MISGYFFYYKYDGTLKSYYIQLQKRIKSTLIPYFLWSLSWYIVYNLTKLKFLDFSDLFNSFINPINKYCKDKIRIEYFPSWSEESLPSTEIASEVEFNSSTFNVLFTGNIGEAQDFPSIIDAAECLRNDNVRWIIVGDGRKYDWLKKEIIHRDLKSQIILLGEFPIERMSSFYNHSQALLVSLKQDYFLSLVIPGKVQSYLMSGLPILGMVEGETEQVIKKSGCGYSCKPGDGRALADIVKQMMSTSISDRRLMGDMGRNFAIKEFDRKTLLKKLESWMIEYANNYDKKSR